jgi:ABC-2 type transport system permease protein
MKQFLVFVRKEFYHILRDKRSMMVLLGIPIVQIVLFGFAILGRVEDGHAGVLHLGGDGKTEKDYLHDGHAQQNQHRAPVAEDMEELFSDERYELFHCLYLYLGSDNADFTDFQSAVRTA